MKRILIGLVIGLILLEAGRRLHRPADEAAAAGSAAYRAGDYAAAEAQFREAERDASDPARAAHNRAAALYRLRHFEDADQKYERSADGAALRAARAAYDRGNCAFGEACAEDGTADPDLLGRAAEHYEACLAREGRTPAAGPLFSDARHNLELTRMILAEMAAESAAESTAAKDAPDPGDAAGARDDPFAPSNAAHPPEGEDRQKAPDAQARADAKANAGPKKEGQPPPGAEAKAGPDAKPDPKAEGQKAADAQARADAQASARPRREGEPPPGAEPKVDPKAPQEDPPQNEPGIGGKDAKEQRVKEVNTVEKGGCPKCKKNPNGLGGVVPTQVRGNGTKPNPGQDDNGKAPGKGKSPTAAHHPGGSGKPTPGEGGKPGEKNGVGKAKEPGTGEVDDAARTGHKSPPGPAQEVGPDGVAVGRQDKPAKGGQAGEGDGPADDVKKPARPGGKNGAPLGAAGEAGKPHDAKDQPPPAAEVDKLFKPGTPRPNEPKDGPSGGMMAGPSRAGSGRFGIAPDADVTDGSGDPVERAATRRLLQAIQRIQGARENRQPLPGAAKGEAPAPDRRRDW
jgi:hypothetical protein